MQISIATSFLHFHEGYHPVTMSSQFAYQPVSRHSLDSPVIESKGEHLAECGCCAGNKRMRRIHWIAHTGSLVVIASLLVLLVQIYDGTLMAARWWDMYNWYCEYFPFSTNLRCSAIYLPRVPTYKTIATLTLWIQLQSTLPWPLGPTSTSGSTGPSGTSRRSKDLPHQQSTRHGTRSCNMG